MGHRGGRDRLPTPEDAGPACGGLTLERIVGVPAVTGTAPVSPAWSPDGRQLAFLWNPDGRPELAVWLVAGEETAPVRLTGAAQGFAWLPGGYAVVFLADGDVWRTDVPDGPPVRLTADGGPKKELAVSPDGRYVSFLMDGDLWLVSSQGGSAVRATSVGVPPLCTVPLGTYFRPEVEIGPATWGGPSPAYAWSPDGRVIAVHYVDRRQVPTMSIPYYLADPPMLNTLRRGRPGDVNEFRTIGFYDVEERLLHLLHLEGATETRVISFNWSPEGILLIDRQSDDAVERALCLADPRDARIGSVREIWRDRRETRIYTEVASAWHQDGRRILLTGDLEDRYRLYVLDPDSGSLTVLSPAEFDVFGAGIPVPGRGDVVYVSSEPSPYERHVWRTDELGHGRTRLTLRPGVHTPFLSPDGDTLALLSTDDVTPTELYLTSASSPTPPRRITCSMPPESRSFPWAAARYVSFPHRIDPFTVHARILEPPRLDPGKKYPVIFGPMYSNTVRNRWDMRFGALQQYLVVEREYIVVQVDVRGSTGYGRDFREAFLMDWGGGDLEDVASAVDYVGSLPYVDQERMGIWGTSYGGTLTVYMLFKKPGLFRAGVAAAPAVDPYYFGSDDVAICRRPATHPQAFTRGATRYAAGLRDNLLIVHGVQDDVVPFQTTVALAEELIKLGKDFQVAFAPAATHAWSERSDCALYLMRRLVDHFDRYLRA